MNEKLTSSPYVRKMSALAQPSLIRVNKSKKFEKSEVFNTKKCERPHLSSPLSEKFPHWINPFSPDCGRLLWTAFLAMTS